VVSTSNVASFDLSIKTDKGGDLFSWGSYLSQKRQLGACDKPLIGVQLKMSDSVLIMLSGWSRKLIGYPTITVKYFWLGTFSLCTVLSNKTLVLNIRC